MGKSLNYKSFCAKKKTFDIRQMLIAMHNPQLIVEINNQDEVKQ